MANYSRTEKYRELRDKLQHDTGDSGTTTKELSRFERRLNQLDSNNFAEPGRYSADDHDPLHARRETAPAEQISGTVTETNDQTSQFDLNVLGSVPGSAEDTDDNEYLNQYIREVKQYNIDQGNAISENTSLNILRQLNANVFPAEKKKETPVSRPYPNTAAQGIVADEQRNSNTGTTDIPFKTSVRKRYDDLVNTEKLPVQKPEKISEIRSDTDTMSKEDIMAEVQNLVNGTEPSAEYDPVEPVDYGRNTDYDRTTRQQLINETTQMRAQLDDYEDNLTEVSNKMNHTNRILNIVLIVLICALAVMLGVVIYWIVLTRGV